jgi:sugar-specific transcriptional regulator TrmB
MTPKEDNPKSPVASAKETRAAQCARPMEISSELLNTLQNRFKLSESQSRAYTVLLVIGQMTADEVSNYSGIPMIKVRSAIEALEKNQLIKRLPGVVPRYRAFAPYKELADEVQAFSKDTKKSWNELQKLQTQIISEIHDELQLMIKQTQSAMENLNERQGIALNEATMATNIVLSNVVETLQKSLGTLSSSSADEISEQITSIQQALNNLIVKGKAQLDDAQKLALEDATKAISAYQEEAETWISSTAEQLLEKITATTQQLMVQLNDVNTLQEHNIDSGIKSLTSEISSQKEGISEITEDTAVTLTTDIETYNQETQKVLETLQKDSKQVLTKYTQDFMTQIRDTWMQRTQVLDNLLSQLEKTIQKDNRRLVQQIDDSVKTMDTTIKSSRDASVKIIETLFQNLKKTHNHSSMELRRLHKEAETTVTQWPPSSLSFSQLSKIKTASSTLTEQVKTEHEQLLESASQVLSIEMRDAFLAQLLEMESLLQTLIKETETQQATLAENFKSITDQVGKRIKRRLKAIQKTTESFLSDFQTQVNSQEQQNRTLGKQLQKILSTEASTAVKVLEVTENQLSELAAGRLEQAQSTIKQSATKNLAKATKEQKAVERQVQSFGAALKKIIKETTSELQKELAKLESIVRQYSEGIESTADKLRAEQVHKIDSVIGNYQPAITDIQTTRDNNITKIVRNLTSQLQKRDQAVLSGLNTILSENIPVYAFATLNEYQATLEKKKAALNTQAVAATEPAIRKQLNATKLKEFNSEITAVLNNHINDVSAILQEFLAKQGNLQSTQSDTAFNLARDEFVEVYGKQFAKYNDLVAKSFITHIKPIIRDCKTKVTRQSNRDKQIEKLTRIAFEEIRTLLKPILAKEEKLVRDNANQELDTIFQTFTTQLTKQTNRDKQIADVFQSSIANLETMPKALLSEVSNQHLDDQMTDLLAIFIESQSALNRQQMTNTKRLTTEFNSLLKKLAQTNYAKSLKPQLNSLLKTSSKDILQAYQAKIAENHEALKAQAETVFQTTLEKQLQNQLQPKLIEYSTTRIPSFNEPMGEMNTKISETVKEYDVNARTLIEQYWLPLTKTIDEFSSALVGNITALNTATGTAVDQALVNVNASLTNFVDDSSNLLTATVQNFDREKSGITEQITQGIREMQDDCLEQLQETQTLLETLSSDITTQKTTTEEKIEIITKEIDDTVKSNLTAIREVANSFVENVQSELQAQEARVDNLGSNLQDLIGQQEEALIDGVDRIQTQLVKFAETQIPTAQSTIEEIGQSCATRIDEQRSAINTLFEAFSHSLTEEIDNYVSTLQQELVQLQTVTSKLVEQLGESSDAIETELVEQIETNRVNLLSTIDAQQTALSKETSETFQSFTNQSREIQTQLNDNLKQAASEAKEVLEHTQTKITTALEEIRETALTKSDKSYQTQIETLKLTTQTMIVQMGENLSAFGSKITTSSDQLLESLSSTLTSSQTELSKVFDNTNAMIEENEKTLQNEIGQEVEKALQNQTKATSLTDSRLQRAIQDSMRRTNESLQSLNSAASTELQQKSKSIVATINQVLDNTKEGLVTQTQQTGTRISRTLSKERDALKSEYQNLAKEITARTKTAEKTAINSLQLFSTQTEPTLDRLRTEAERTEGLLIGLWETLTKMEPSEAERTWRIVTCEGIQSHLLDMFRRVAETITLVYPSFDEVPVSELSKINPKNRVHIITTLDGEKQLTSAQKLLQQGNIRIWNNPKMEFYGGSRDGEEVLIAPTYGNQGEIVAVVSDQASYIALFNQTLGPRWISASNEIRLRSQ